MQLDTKRKRGGQPKNRICDVDGCDAPHEGLGYCKKHYQNYKKYGHPTEQIGKGNGRHKSSVAIDRFMTRLIFDGSGCWNWGGKRMKNGYGIFATGGTGNRMLAHRWSYQHFTGPIPDGLQLDHLCRNKACVNPDHLEPVTAAENLRRARLAQEVSTS